MNVAMSIMIVNQQTIISRNGAVMIKEPILHTHITDMLDDAHPKAHKSIFCNLCKAHVHAFNNECMQSWFETGKGDFCFKCFIKLNPETEVIEDGWGLPIGECVNKEEGEFKDKDYTEVTEAEEGPLCIYCEGPTGGLILTDGYCGSCYSQIIINGEESD